MTPQKPSVEKKNPIEVQSYSEFVLWSCFVNTNGSQKSNQNDLSDTQPSEAIFCHSSVSAMEILILQAQTGLGVYSKHFRIGTL